MTRPYGTSNSKLLFAWLEATEDPIRREALLAWIAVMVHDPRVLCHQVFSRGTRAVWVAHVPTARVRVTYAIFDVPARAVHYLEFSDDAYDPALAERPMD